MKGRLVYVIGPSGSGKDSVLEYARTRLPLKAGLIFSRRFITREPLPGGEQHIPVSESDFERLLARGGFALHWSANGLRYGIGAEIRTWMGLGFHVVVNGSREYLPLALQDFPCALVICITAPIDILRQRLGGRGRESDAQIEQRIQRTAALPAPTDPHIITIANDGALEVAGNALTQTLLSLRAESRA